MSEWKNLSGRGKVAQICPVPPLLELIARSTGTKRERSSSLAKYVSAVCVSLIAAVPELQFLKDFEVRINRNIVIGSCL
jgi:hypothetical protein